MAVDFFFDPATFDIPTLGTLRCKWANIHDLDVREVIAREDQFLQFHIFSLKSIKHTNVGGIGKNDCYVLDLGLSVRGGAIKAALLVCASIAEAALRYHAEARQFSLHHDPKKRMFGNIINAWESNSIPHQDVALIWSDVKSLRDIRNNIHLFKAAGDPNANFEKMLATESTLLGGALNVVFHLSRLASP